MKIQTVSGIEGTDGVWFYWGDENGVHRFVDRAPLGEKISEEIETVSPFYDKAFLELAKTKLVYPRKEYIYTIQPEGKYFAVGLGFFVAVVLFVIYLVRKG